MHILVIRFSSLGDIVLTTGFCSWIKKHYPDSKIDFLTLEQNALLLEENPHLEKVHTYKKQSGLKDIKSLFQLAKKLKQQDYRFIVDLHGNTRSFILRNFLYHIPSLVLDKWRVERSLLIKYQKDFLRKAPKQFERGMHDFAKTLCIPYERNDLFQWQKAQGLKNITTSHASLLNHAKEHALAICPGASFKTKKYPVQYFIQIARDLMQADTKLKLYIIGGPDEMECDEIADSLKDYSDRVYNQRAKISLRDSIDLIAKVKLVLGNDSFFGHIADSVNIPALSIFGPTDERFGYAPYGVFSKTYSVKNLNCRPCSLTGNKNCYRTNQFCMDNINRQEIIRDILERLKD
tara:strand:- start:2695 stop:3738 length:1044 start_codon:yes stop_codon:yes gene_type:complete